jgi:hypothetical protein
MEILGNIGKELYQQFAPDLAVDVDKTIYAAPPENPSDRIGNKRCISIRKELSKLLSSAEQPYVDLIQSVLGKDYCDDEVIKMWDTKVKGQDLVEKQNLQNKTFKQFYDQNAQRMAEERQSLQRMSGAGEDAQKRYGLSSTK